MAAVTICSDFGTQEKKVCHYFHCFPIYLPWRDGTRYHDLSFLNVEWFFVVVVVLPFWRPSLFKLLLKFLFWHSSSLLFGMSFKPLFSFSSFTFIKKLFSSSSLSAIRVVSSAYLRLLLFLPAILIPACASSSLAFHQMYSACKLNLSRVTTYRLDVLLSQFGISLLFHVWF